MLERWTIQPSPTPKDPKQHTLFLKAEKREVYAVLREFGAICGRPQRTSKDDYNYSLVLHRMSPQNLQAIEGFLSSRSKASPAPKPVPKAEPPEVRAAPAPKPAPKAEPPEVRVAPAPSALKAPSLQPASPAPPAGQDKPVIEPGKSAARLGKPAAAPLAVQAAAEAPEDPLAREVLYGAACAPDPLQTFDALMAGPFNRFAHAAGTAVVANPGSMYNPLVLFGAPGVGKSHFLSAIGHSLQERTDGKHIFLTSGCKLAWAADLAAAQNKTGMLMSHAEGSAGLLIDDAHLMSFTERNQAGLKSLVHHYLDAGKPVVMASAYAPKALQFIEEALQFQIGSGYAVEIKLPGPEARPQILRAAMTRCGLEADDEAVKELQGALGSGFLDLNRWLRRLRAFKTFRSNKGEKPGVKEMLALLLAGTGQTPPGRDTAAALSQAPALEISASPDAKRAALVFPAGQESQAQHLLLQFRDAAQRGGLSLQLKALVHHAYDPDQLYGVPAAIGEASRRAGASAVLMMGPMPNTQLAAHEGELHHALDHTLAGLKVPLSFISFLLMQDSKVYLQAVLDVYFGLWAPWQP